MDCQQGDLSRHRRGQGTLTPEQKSVEAVLGIKLINSVPRDPQSAFVVRCGEQPHA